MADLGDLVGHIKYNLDSKGLDDAKSKMDDTKESGFSLNNFISEHLVVTFGDLVNAGKQVADAVWSFAKAAGDDEAAVHSLGIAMQAQGIFSQNALDTNVAWANSLQTSTTFSHEQILAVMKLYTQLGMHDEELRNVVKSTLDLGAATGSLDTASTSMARAYEGITSRTLKLYGIEIPKGVSGTEALTYATQKLAENLGGTAAGETDTFNGKLIQMKNSFNDMKELIGAPFLEPLKTLFDTMKEGTKTVEDTNTLLAAEIELMKKQSDGAASQNIVVKSLTQEWMNFVNTTAKIGQSLNNAWAKTTKQIIDTTHKGNEEITADDIKAGDELIDNFGKRSNAEVAQDEKKNQALIEANKATLKKLEGDTAAYMNQEKADYDEMQKDHIKYYQLLAKAGGISLEQQRKDIEQELSYVKDGTARHAELTNQLAEIEKKISAEANNTIEGGFKNAMKNMSEATFNWGDQFTTTITDMQNSMAGSVKSMMDGTKNFGDGVGALWGNLRDSVIADIEQMIAKWLAFQALKAVASGGLSLLGFADGGDNISAGTYLVGEEGPELMNVPGGSSIVNNHDTKNMLNQGGTTININASGPANKVFAQQIGDIVMQQVNTNRKWH